VAYDRKRYMHAYMAGICAFYRPRHIERMTGMIMKAIGLTSNGRLWHIVSALNWKLLQWRLAHS